VVLLVVDVADFDGSFPAVAAKMLSSIGESLHVVRLLCDRFHHRSPADNTIAGACGHEG
jgi:hypothetical protein